VLDRKETSSIGGKFAPEPSAAAALPRRGQNNDNNNLLDESDHCALVVNDLQP
jgi:hypothetical protein